jgi:hypothetical protein
METGGASVRPISTVGLPDSDGGDDVCDTVWVTLWPLVQGVHPGRATNHDPRWSALYLNPFFLIAAV